MDENGRQLPTYALSRSRANQLRRPPGSSRLQPAEDREALPKRMNSAARSLHQTTLTTSSSCLEPKL